MGLRALFLFVVVLVLSSSSALLAQVPALHSHNDERRATPLFEALAAGATRIEVDVWRIGSVPQLYTGHDVADTAAGHTLQSQYLDPLAALPPEARPARLDLVIDAKVVPQFRAVQAPAIYHETIAAVQARPALAGWLRVVFTGATVAHTIANRPAWVEFQHWGVSAASLAEPVAREPVEAEGWPFSWQGVGEMPADELAALEAQSARVRAAGKRYLLSTYFVEATGDPEAVWSVLRGRVDIVSTDDPARYAAWVDSLTSSEPVDAGPAMCQCPCE